MFVSSLTLQISTQSKADQMHLSVSRIKAEEGKQLGSLPFSQKRERKDGRTTHWFLKLKASAWKIACTNSIHVY
jgi:hypothetical protein